MAAIERQRAEEEAAKLAAEEKEREQQAIRTREEEARRRAQALLEEAEAARIEALKEAHTRELERRENQEAERRRIAEAERLIAEREAAEADNARAEEEHRRRREISAEEEGHQYRAGADRGSCAVIGIIFAISLLIGLFAAGVFGSSEPPLSANQTGNETADTRPFCDNVISAAENTAQPPARADDSRNVITVTADESIMWNNAEVDLNTLREYLEVAAGYSPQPTLILETYAHRAREETVRTLISQTLRCQLRF